MALPMQSTPTFNLKIPSTGKIVKYRPFVVKEEKALLIAQQSEDTKIMIDSLMTVLQGCILDKIDINSLAMFDLEYMFLQIRGKSVGENVDLFFMCDEDHGELNEKAKSKVTINLSEIEVVVPEGHTNKIPLFGDVGVVMKYPSLEDAGQVQDFENIDEIFNLALKAKMNGQEQIPVHIFPINYYNFNSLRFFDEKMNKNKSLIDFEKNIFDGFIYFENNSNLPKITVDESGKYIFN